MQKIMIRLGTAAVLMMFAAGCASSKIKARKEERDKVSLNSHLFCDFVNGETYPDVEVEMNIEMAKRCDPEMPMTITAYRSPSDNTGIIYCCTQKDQSTTAPVSRRASPVKEVKEVVPAKEVKEVQPAATPAGN